MSYAEVLDHKVQQDFGHKILLCLVRDASTPPDREKARRTPESSPSPQVWSFHLICQKKAQHCFKELYFTSYTRSYSYTALIVKISQYIFLCLKFGCKDVFSFLYFPEITE